MRASRAVLGGSLAFVVLAPALVGAVATAMPGTPAPEESSLTVPLTQNGWFATHTPEHTYVGVRVAGPPPSHPAILTNSSGTVSVRVAIVNDTSKCGSPARVVGNGGTNVWCLDIGSVPLATEVSGEFKGKPTELTVTVDARHGFVALPLVVIILSLVLAIILAVVPGFLDGLIQQGRLWRTVRKNTTLDGLAVWVQTRLQRGADVKDLTEVVGGLIREAPEQARQARQALTAAMGGFPKNHPLAAIADGETARTDLPVTDFVDDDGKPVVHPATLLADLVNLVKELYGQLDDLDTRISALLVAMSVNTRREAAVARRAVDTVTTRAAAEAARHDVDVAWSVYVAVAANPANRDTGFVEAAAEAPEPPAPGFSGPGVLTRLNPTTSLAGPVLATAVFAIVVAALAVASVASATYVGKPTFGSGADYLALALAAFGSSAAGTIATVLAYWHIAGS